MSTEQSRSQVEVSADIAAPPETVWRLISDLNRMGEWSPGVKDRAAHNEAGTLERLKAVAEAQTR